MIIYLNPPVGSKEEWNNNAVIFCKIMPKNQLHITLIQVFKAYYIRGDEWSIKIFNCSQNFTFARFARKI